MNKFAALILLGSAATVCLAVDTHVWEQSDQAEFTRGTPRKLSVRSDGHITLAPEFKELDSTNVPYLWAIAEDSKGTLYYAGGAPTGATTKIYTLSKNAKPKVFADLPGIEVRALAIYAQESVFTPLVICGMLDIWPDRAVIRRKIWAKPGQGSIWPPKVAGI
jgi:hypothetical protein